MRRKRSGALIAEEPVVEEQLERAGVRLAEILNRTLK
jgi:hypothetical protein